MKAGTYYIGDLCYVMHPQWDEFCEITIRGNNVINGEFKLSNGVEFATYSTMHGDGCYLDNEEYEYPVDAGLIGCIRLDDINDPKFDRDNVHGRIHTFDKPFRTYEEKWYHIFW